MMRSRWSRAGFSVREVRVRARVCLSGMLSGLERKTGRSLAEHAGEASPDGMQRLFVSARWDEDLVRDDLRGYVAAVLGAPDGASGWTDTPRPLLLPVHQAGPVVLGLSDSEGLNALQQVSTNVERLIPGRRMVGVRARGHLHMSHGELQLGHQPKIAVQYIG